MQDEVLDEERCQHEVDAPPGQGLVGIHEVLEIVRVDGREIVRRSEIHCCETHLAAIRRARTYGEEPAKLAKLMLTSVASDVA